MYLVVLVLVLVYSLGLSLGLVSDLAIRFFISHGFAPIFLEMKGVCL